MPPQNRISRIRLSSRGEIMGEFKSAATLLKPDFKHLDRVGLEIFQDIFTNSQGDEILNSRPANVLRRSVYVLGCQLITLKKQKLLEEFNQREAKSSKVPQVTKKAPDVNENPFHWCYMLLLGENRLTKGNKRVISRDQISKSSRMLVYAQKNNVPAEYLIGFIAQIGGDTILELHKKRDWEGWKTAKRIDKTKKD